MSEVNEKNCRLCLKLLDVDYNVIEEITRGIFGALLLKVDLSVSEEPLMCKSCMESIQEAYDFKSTCIAVNEQIVSLALDRYPAELDIRDVYLNNDENKSLVFNENYNVCRFCLQCIEKNLLNYLRKDLTDEILPTYIPELDLNIIKEPVICATCMKSLKSYYSFAMKCQNTEDNVMKIYGLQGVECNRQISLSSVLKFMPERTGNCSKTTALIEEHLFKENEEYVCPDTNKVELKREERLIKELKIEEELVIKHEDKYVDCETEENRCSETEWKEVKYDMILAHKDSSGEPMLIHTNNSEVTINSNLYNYELKCQNYLKNTNSSNVVMYRCERCPFEAKYKQYLKRHMLIHKDNSEVTMYKCKICNYETKRKNYLPIHMLTHKDSSDLVMYKCDGCTFETKHKTSLKMHMLIHKEKADVIMYRCNLCNYKAKRKENLKQHMVTHKDSSDVIMFRCEVCTFETKYKHSINQHVRIHRDNSEVTMYNNDLCNNETKSTQTSKTQMDFSDVVLYKCETCTFETKYEPNLKEHELSHKINAEVPMYKCNLCSYETEGENYLKDHVLTHKDSSDIVMYRCDKCKFETKHKSALRRHMLIHKDKSEVILYKCDLCSYEAKWKNCLKKHILTHKDSTDVKMYRCERCTYETKYKQYLKEHTLIHKNKSEVILYRCNVCNYEAKQKVYLKRHMLSHKDPSEVVMFRCELCTFETKYKQSLNQHMHIHRESSEVTM